MTYKPQNLSGAPLRATRWAIRTAGAQRLWNVQSFYNGTCISGPCHAALSTGRLRQSLRAAEARQEAATGVWDSFRTTVASDIRRGAYLSGSAARPVTATLDALVGTGRCVKTMGPPEERLLRTLDGVGSHFTHTGVLGAILLGTAVASALVGATLGAFTGGSKGALGIPMAWVVDRRAPWATVGRSMGKGAVTGAGNAAIVHAVLLWLEVQVLRLVSAGVKGTVVAAGATLGLAVGLAHGLAVAYSLAALGPQLQLDSRSIGANCTPNPTV